MKVQRIAGLTLMLVGAVLFIIGAGASHSVADRASDALIGRFTNATMGYLATGLAATLLGVFTILLGGEPKAATTPPLESDDIHRRRRTEEDRT